MYIILAYTVGPKIHEYSILWVIWIPREGDLQGSIQASVRYGSRVGAFLMRMLRLIPRSLRDLTTWERHNPYEPRCSLSSPESFVVFRRKSMFGDV